MALAKSYQNSPTHLPEEESVQVNLDSLILAMFTAFNIRLTRKNIVINIVNLFSELNLAIPENLIHEIFKSVDTLVQNNFLITKEGDIKISELGKGYGETALQDFRETVPEFFRN